MVTFFQELTAPQITRKKPANGRRAPPQKLSGNPLRSLGLLRGEPEKLFSQQYPPAIHRHCPVMCAEKLRQISVFGMGEVENAGRTPADCFLNPPIPSAGHYSGFLYGRQTANQCV